MNREPKELPVRAILEDDVNGVFRIEQIAQVLIALAQGKAISDAKPLVEPPSRLQFESRS